MTEETGLVYTKNQFWHELIRAVVLMLVGL